MREMRPDGSVPALTSIFVLVFETHLPAASFNGYCAEHLLNADYLAVLIPVLILSLFLSL